MGFSGNDNLHHQEFLVQVENFRRVFIKMLNNKHTFGGSKTGDWGWEADNSFYKSVPDFKYQPVTLASVFSIYTMDVAVLIGWSIFVMLLIRFGTKKMEIL